MTQSATFCLISAGAFFLVGLLSGVWKYACIYRSPDATAPFYVDTAHRASLLYAFACALTGELCGRSAWPDRINLVAAIVLIAFFALAVLGYLVHGALNDTDNQLRRPHKLGRGTVAPASVLAFMIALVVAEVGGFAVIFAGFLVAL